MISKTDLYFLTISKTGSLTQAAQQLYVSQPSLSKYLHRLETRLGAPLFDRSVSPMRLTECGMLYLQHLKDSIEREKQLLEQIGEITQNIRGTLRLGIPYFCGQCYLPQVLPLFINEFPHVSLELYEKPGVKLEQALIDQTIDLAILYSPIIHETLAQRFITNERILMAVRRDPALSWNQAERIHIREGTFNDLIDKPVIMPSSEQKLGRAVINFFSKLGYQPPIYTRAENTVTMLELAAYGCGICFTPESGLNTVSERILEQLMFFSFTNGLSNWKLAAVTRQGTIMSPFSKRFVELMRTCAQQKFS